MKYIENRCVQLDAIGLNTPSDRDPLPPPRQIALESILIAVIPRSWGLHNMSALLLFLSNARRASENSSKLLFMR